MPFNAAIGTLSVKITADTSDVRRGIKATNKDLSKSGKALKKNEQQWKRWGAATKLVISGVVVLATRELIRYSDVFTALSNKLKISTNSTRELAAITKTLFDVSRDTRTGVETTVDLYAKLERSTRNLDISQDRLVKITSSINKSFAIMGATAAESSGAIRQLGQAFALGALRGDELNSISEQAPIIMEAVRAATGKTAGELRKLAETGAITAEILIESLERYANKIDTDFAQATATFGQKLVNAKTNAIEFVGANDAITKSVGLLGDATLGLSENLDTLATVLQVVAIAVGSKFIGPMVASGLALLATNAKALLASRGLLTMAASARVARIALAFLGGPVGILLAVAASLAVFVDWESKSEKQTKDTTDAIEKQNKAFKNFTLEQAQKEMVNLSKITIDSEFKLLKLREELTKVEEKLKSPLAGSSILGGSRVAFQKTTEIAKKLREEILAIETAATIAAKGFKTLEDLSGKKEQGEQDLIDIEGKAAAEAEEKRNNKALEAFSRHLFRMRQAEAKAAVALREQKLKAAEDDLAALNQKLMTEQELEGFFHQQDLQTAQVAFEQGIATAAERDAIIEESERQHKQRLNDIEFAENEMKRQIFERDANGLISSIASLGKKSLKIQKAAALAQAAVAIHTGIARAQELGFPANIFEAIRVAAVGVSAIRGIKSAKVGSAPSISAGGTGGGVTSGGGGVSSAPQQQQISRKVTINLVGGDIRSQEGIRQLIEQLNEAIGDGAELNVGG